MQTAARRSWALVSDILTSWPRPISSPQPKHEGATVGRAFSGLPQIRVLGDDPVDVRVPVLTPREILRLTAQLPAVTTTTCPGCQQATWTSSPSFAGTTRTTATSTSELFADRSVPAWSGQGSRCVPRTSMDLARCRPPHACVLLFGDTRRVCRGVRSSADGELGWWGEPAMLRLRLRLRRRWTALLLGLVRPQATLAPGHLDLLDERSARVGRDTAGAGVGRTSERGRILEPSMDGSR